MTKQIYSALARKIGQHKKEIETALSVKLNISSNVITIEGEATNELTAEEAIEAINLGFSIDQALELKNEDFIFQKISIKKVTKRSDLSQVRARVIGTERKALRNIEYLTNCDIVLHENVVGVIGQFDDVKKAVYALKKLISGSKYANVYKYLEDQRVRERETF
jgi:KH domain-containing protein